MMIIKKSDGTEWKVSKKIEKEIDRMSVESGVDPMVILQYLLAMSVRKIGMLCAAL